MSLDDLFRHTLVIKRLAAAVDTQGAPILDGLGEQKMTASTLATVDGRIRPLSAREAREVSLPGQNGAVLTTHACDLYPVTGLGTDCWIESGGVRYDIVAMPDAAGQGHHLILGLKAVQ